MLVRILAASSTIYIPLVACVPVLLPHPKSPKRFSGPRWAGGSSQQTPRLLGGALACAPDGTGKPVVEHDEPFDASCIGFMSQFRCQCHGKKPFWWVLDSVPMFFSCSVGCCSWNPNLGIHVRTETYHIPISRWLSFWWYLMHIWQRVQISDWINLLRMGYRMILGTFAKKNTGNTWCFKNWMFLGRFFLQPIH